jgi:hypothetical protein
MSARDDSRRRQDRALALRLGGCTYREIAQELGWAGQSCAQRAVRLAALRAAPPVRDELARVTRALGHAGGRSGRSRAGRAVDLRLAGLSHTFIAQALGYASASGSIEACRRASANDPELRARFEAQNRSRHQGRPVRRTEHGYLLVRLPDHPLANGTGDVYEHRAVAYNEYGPEPQPCVDCGDNFDWPQLCVLHANGDRVDNDPANLLLICRSCRPRRIHAEHLTGRAA